MVNREQVIQTTTIGRLYSVLVGQPSAVLLLGAGASIRSGIPLASGVVEKAARWAYAREHGRVSDDPRLQRSDWLPWLKAKPWYREDLSPAENYHATVENLLQPRQERANFFLDLINPGVEPSIGYEKLAEFLHQGVIRTLLTTNFDECPSDVRRKLRRPHHLDLIRTESDYLKFSTSPAYPQEIYLHGSVAHYSDKNLQEEVQRLDDRLVGMLVPLLRDHPLIVIGYRGGEPSVMEHLLIENAEETNGYRNGIYWCALQNETPAPLVQKLANVIAANFQLVPIAGFDELLGEELWPLFQAARPASPVQAVHVGQNDSPTLDMQPLSQSNVDGLEWSTMRDRIATYCQRLDIRVPEHPDRRWVTEQLVAQNLALRQVSGSIVPTVAGYLLFAQAPQDRLPSAKVIVRMRGEPAWLEKTFGSERKLDIDSTEQLETVEAEQLIEGNLWTQLNAITEALTLFNKPFRLKGDVSEMVYPYPPLALKEVIVNALVHRDYAVAETVTIEIEPTHIRITNPGGLVDEVRRRVEPDSIEEEIRRGERGIKGYRNPAIADLFYGAGDMDKAGSGLADVYKHVHSAFTVTLHCRPEAVDELTRTASPLRLASTRFAGNVLELLELPEVVWHAGTSYRRAGDIWRKLGAEWLPPFLLFGGRLYTFHDMSDPVNLLRDVVDVGDVEPLSLEEFAEGKDGLTRFVWLFNECLYRHLEARGLMVDKKRKRAYFPKTEEGLRQVTYQARLRRATRTVVKPRTNPTSGKVRYWEHEAFSFRLERFGDAWGLMLLPGYVFTFNGYRGLLAADRVNVLSTKRAARDYNPNVLNDLIFWTWVLAGGRDGSFPLHLGPVAEGAEGLEPWRRPPAPDTAEQPHFVVAAHLPAVTLNDIEIDFDETDVAIFEGELEELDEELTRLAEEEAQIGSTHDGAKGGPDADPS